MTCLKLNSKIDVAKAEAWSYQKKSLRIPKKELLNKICFLCFNFHYKLRIQLYYKAVLGILLNIRFAIRGMDTIIVLKSSFCYLLNENLRYHYTNLINTLKDVDLVALIQAETWTIALLVTNNILTFL